jgi:hypothetical protein
MGVQCACCDHTTGRFAHQEQQLEVQGRARGTSKRTLGIMPVSGASRAYHWNHSSSFFSTSVAKAFSGDDVSATFVSCKMSFQPCACSRESVHPHQYARKVHGGRGREPTKHCINKHVPGRTSRCWAWRSQALRARYCPAGKSQEVVRSRRHRPRGCGCTC